MIPLEIKFSFLVLIFTTSHSYQAWAKYEKSLQTSYCLWHQLLIHVARVLLKHQARPRWGWAYLNFFVTWVAPVMPITINKIWRRDGNRFLSTVLFYYKHLHETCTPRNYNCRLQLVKKRWLSLLLIVYLFSWFLFMAFISLPLTMSHVQESQRSLNS